jgi:NodT family efflux transporter outer membrane factor (OMF) lipoprotein
MAVPEKFREPTGTSENPPGVPDEWWLKLHDPVLNDLIEQALKSAPNVAVAEARVRVARAYRSIAGADRLPTVDANSFYARSRGSANVPVGVPPGGLGPGIDSNLWQAGFDASWELDVFGGVRRSIQMAQANFESAEYERTEVVLSLIAEIARNEIELRCAQRRLELTRRDIAREEDTLKLSQALLQAGLIPRLDVLRAKAQVADFQAQVPMEEAEISSDIYRLGALVGREPEELTDVLSTAQAIPRPDGAVSAGLPSDLLRRRPDIQAADRRIAAATARIGVAQADYYPHFLLTGSAGLESLHAGTFPDIDSGYYSVGPGLTWRIFDARRIHFKVVADEAQLDEATAEYRGLVLSALREVETALASFAQNQIRRNDLETEVQEDEAVVALATRLYSQGLENFLTVLDAQQALFAAEDKLAESERDLGIAFVSLCKALGGGWQPPPHGR